MQRQVVDVFNIFSDQLESNRLARTFQAFTAKNLKMFIVIKNFTDFQIAQEKKYSCLLKAAG